MNVYKWLRDVTKPLHQHVYDHSEDLLNQKTVFETRLKDCMDETLVLRKELMDLRDEVIAHKCPVLNTKFAIDSHLESKHPIVPNIAYKNKRQVNKVFYSVYLNQMITPGSFEVKRFLQKHDKYDDLYFFMQHIGDSLARHTTWINEERAYKTKDYYLYPEETLTGMRKKCDCEDVSFVMGSFKPNISAVAFGYFHKKSGKYGHAWPVFLYSDKLYIVETTGDFVEIVENDDKRYEAVYYVTQNFTYKAKNGVTFGDRDRLTT